MLYLKAKMPCNPTIEERFLYIISHLLVFYLEVKMPCKPIIGEIFLYITVTDALSGS